MNGRNLWLYACSLYLYQETDCLIKSCISLHLFVRNIIVIMRNILLLLFFLSGLSLHDAIAQTAQRVAKADASFSNPLKVQLGDPYVLHTGGMYYMYGTGGGADKG